MDHVVIKDSELNGWEYGMLRSFENAIVQETGGRILELPPYRFASKYMHHFSQGMKRGKYRKYFQQQPFDIKADIAWCILMGPENYKLDLYKNWQPKCKIKILYLYDTLPAQYPLIKRLLSDNTWDILITAFNDAVDDLEKLTGRKWHCVEQAADAGLFQPAPLSERVIHFSSYGRKHPVLHEAVKEFCEAHHLYYDYTTHDAKHPVADASELYKQYAWHLTHSQFTFSWPVELTHSQRAGHLHPITCRWFEAVAAGTVIAGQAPGNPAFTTYFEKDLVVPMNYNATKKDFIKDLEGLMSNRDTYYSKAAALSEQLKAALTWNERVQRIIKMI
ncbi:MAG: glycosyltransferase [Chitinophagaceae bacterium]